MNQQLVRNNVLKIPIVFCSTVNELPQETVIVARNLYCSSNTIPAFGSMANPQTKCSFHQAEQSLYSLRHAESCETKIKKEYFYTHFNTIFFFNFFYAKQKRSRIVKGSEVTMIPGLSGKFLLVNPCGYTENSLLEVIKLTGYPVNIAVLFLSTDDLELFAHFVQQIPTVHSVRCLYGVVPSFADKDGYCFWSVEIIKSIINQSPWLLRPFVYKKSILKGLQKKGLCSDLIVGTIFPFLGIRNTEIPRVPKTEIPNSIPFDSFPQFG